VARTIESIMTKEIVSVEPTLHIEDALKRMRSDRVSCVIVCEKGIPVGIISERDVVAIAASPLSARQTGLTTGDFMSSPVTTVRATDTLDEVVVEAEQAQIRHLAVVHADGLLAGLVTQSDLLRAYASQMEALVAERTAQLSEANQKLELLSRQDGLLGIGNRRAMDDNLAQVHEVATRYLRPYSLVLCDVDHFKAYNDRYGHLAGDDVLQRLADRIVEISRSVDQVYRYGGEEILVLLPETPCGSGASLAQRICDAVSGLAIPHEESPHGVVTLSCGVAGLSATGVGPETWQDVVRSADEALYRAKSAGRNRVESAESG
jgi:diguanylate cyclase (GGDEF)-like protein